MIVLFFTCAVVIVDQWTKFLVRTQFELYESKTVIDGFFQLTYVTNDGMAFGLNFPGGFYLFTTASVVMTIVLFYYLWKEKSNNLLLRISLALILGGAIGNLIDRVILHSVVDFFDFIFGTYHFYIFNVADSSVTVGMILFLVYSFFLQPKEKLVTNLIEH